MWVWATFVGMEFENIHSISLARDTIGYCKISVEGIICFLGLSAIKCAFICERPAIYAWIFIRESYPCNRSLPARPISTRKAQSTKKMYLCTPPEFLKQMCRSCLIIIKYCYFDYSINKPSTCSRCLICDSCSVSVVSRYYVCKGSGFFYRNYPQINEVRISDHMDEVAVCTLIFP